MPASDAREPGRDAYARGAWGEAYAGLSAADRDDALEAPDLERLATAAYLVGKETESADTWARAHQAYLDREDAPGAARCALRLASQLLERGESAGAGGWLARARRLLDDGRHECVERGFLLLPLALERLQQRDVDGALATFEQAVALGERYDDRDLVILARHGQGRALIRLGRTVEGVALLDEVMAAVTAGEASPTVAGTVYCSVLSACRETFDVRRAREWTAALTRWCAAQPDLVPFRGWCLVRRAEVMQLQGAWPAAEDEAQRARTVLAQTADRSAAGAAWYQLAELARLRGDFAAAEDAYREASRAGRKPEPGLALLRLAQGQVAAAVAAIRRVTDEARERHARAAVLPACVEIMLAAGDVPAARSAADELAGLAAELEAPLLAGLSTQALGAVRLAEDEPHAALAALRRAAAAWSELDAPYEAARVRVLVGLACRGLGDHDAAELELDAAREAFRRLGAASDLTRLEDLRRREPAPPAGGLTPREVQVLRAVAGGKTNRAIAADLGISEKTVARHVSNIFTKLGLSSRAAATAYAYEHHLV